MNTFKNGDVLFYLPYGKVYYLRECVFNKDYSDILIDFNDINGEVKGKLTHVPTALLSFTEYTLEGFTQQRPIELPEIGEWAYFWDKGEKRAIYARYEYKVEGKYLCSDGYKWENVSKTPPVL